MSESLVRLITRVERVEVSVCTCCGPEVIADGPIDTSDIQTTPQAPGDEPGPDAARWTPPDD